MNTSAEKTKKSAPLVFLPETPGRFLWDGLVCLCTIYFAIESPLRIAYGYRHEGSLLWVDLTVILIFCLDIWAQFHTAFVGQGRLITDPREIRSRYLRSWFIIDFIGMLPFHYVFLLLPSSPDSGFWDWTDLLRLARVWQITKAFAYRNPRWFQLRRLAVFMFWVGLAVHLISTGWIIVGGSDDQTDAWSKYLRAFYWTITTVSTTGYGDITPKNNLQTLYAMGTMMIGATMYAAFIGNIASLLTRLDGARAAYQDKLDRLTAFFRYKGLPNSLLKKILAYHAHAWSTGRGYDEESVLSELPDTLRQAVALELNHKILRHLPLFKDAAPEVLEEIAGGMRAQVFTPGDFVFHVGEIGHSMYFISKGEVEVLVLMESNLTQVAILREGDFFGEIALLENSRRTASIRAMDFCTLYELDREPFERVLEKFPAFAEQIRAKVIRRKE